MQKLWNFLTLAATCVVVIITSHPFSQAPGVQDKLAALKESAAQNKQRLTQSLEGPNAGWGRE